MVNLIHILVTIAIIIEKIRKIECQVGIVYSPFVNPGDRPESTRSYSVQDVKVMLELISENEFNFVATYGMGAPNEPYKTNSTRLKSASIAHTGIAAALINKERNKTLLSIYQGVFPAVNEQLLVSEIEVAFETTQIANLLYEGTVSGIIFPSIAKYDDLHPIFLKLQSASSRARAMNLKFGARLWDCFNSFPGLDSNDNATKEMIGLFDFIVCQTMPTKPEFSRGPQSFVKRITRNFNEIQNSVTEIGGNNQQEIQVILESGWPSGDKLGEQNTVEKMNQFWELLSQWANDGDKKKMIFLHEAFNNPWKEGGMKDVVWANHYGRWVHLDTESNEIGAYALKRDSEKVLLVPKAIPELDVEVPEPPKGYRELIIGIVSGVVLLLVAIIILLFYKLNNGKGERLGEDEIRQFREGISSNEFEIEERKENHCKWLPYDMSFELAKHSFSIDKTALLGNGNFGSVYKGHISGLPNNVAFKMIKSGPEFLPGLRGLLSEIKILTYLGKYENIVSICGAYTKELEQGIVYLALELCTNGSLDKYLRNRKSGHKNIAPVSSGSPETYENTIFAPASQNDYVNSSTIKLASSSSSEEEITDSQLLRWSLDIASAMEYISSKNVIHADLATRNILLTLDLTAKLTDFGLSRRLYEYTEYVKNQQEPLPWKWMAVESLKQMQFSTKSDAWSFGVTLWEIFSFGDVPYPGLSWDINFPSKLEHGLRMSSPTRAPSKVYDIMTRCWDINPTLRPTFGAIKDELFQMELIGEHTAK